jgi:nuclear factor of activated T-cells 5
MASHSKELKILVQPETQHRARYLTEGSRGSVKDRTQQSFPQVKVRHRA